MTLRPHQARVLVECDDLRAKLEKLTIFISSNDFALVEKEEQQRLKLQQMAMNIYAAILMQRIAAFEKSAKEPSPPPETPTVPKLRPA